MIPWVHMVWPHLNPMLSSEDRSKLLELERWALDAASVGNRVSVVAVGIEIKKILEKYPNAHASTA